jgi:hypothetical protein
MFERMLDHPNIEIRLATDFFAVRALLSSKQIIYTGPIDAYSIIVMGACRTAVCASNMRAFAGCRTPSASRNSQLS